MKGHGKHLLMCAPMVAVGIFLLASGSGVAALLPIAACILMMWVMMSAMGGHRGHGR